MKVTDLFENNDEALKMIGYALGNLRWDHLTPQQVLDDHNEQYPQHAAYVGEKDARAWAEWIQFNYEPPAPKTLAGKVKAAARRFNGEVYVDEVEDAIRSQFGDDADNLSVDDILKFMKDGEWGYGPI